MEENSKETLKLLPDDNDIHAVPRDRTESLHVSVKGLGLPDKSITNLESEIRKVIAEEMVKVEEEKLKKKSPSDSGVTEIYVSLAGLDLPDKSITNLESQIKDMVRTQMQPGELRPGPDSEANVCVCAGTSVPGQKTLRFDNLPPWPPAPFTRRIAVYFTQDALRLEVMAHPSYNLGPKEMKVTLESNSSVTWAKEIRTWNFCNGLRVFTRTEGNNHGGYHRGGKIYSRCNGTDTIVFAKAGFGGFMVDIGNFDYRKFWDVFGGKWLHFFWYSD